MSDKHASTSHDEANGDTNRQRRSQRWSRPRRLPHPDAAEILNDAERLAALRRSHTITQIASQLQVPSSAVQTACKRHGIRQRPLPTTTKVDDVDWLKARYLDDDLTADEIAQLAGVSGGMVRNRLARHRILKRQRKS